MQRLKALAVVAVAMGVVVSTAGMAAARLHFVPGSRNVVITGHGYGHGIGMSQYGAEGAARKGKTWRQIVGFYYPGTTVRTAGGNIRVLITGDTTSDVKVSPAAKLHIRDLKAKKAWRLPARPGLTRWRVNPNGWVQRYEGGKWRRWRQMSGNSEFFRPGGAPIRLWVPGSGGEVSKAYRGRLRSVRSNTVNALGLEQYLRGVVPLEMPASWSNAALQAQAVAARTYALRLRAANNSRYYQICDTTSCQVYGGADREDNRADRAVKAVAGKVLKHNGAFALTMFSSSNGGFSASGGLPYLRAQRDTWDGWGGNPVHTWKKTIKARTIESAYPAIGRLIGVNIVSRDGNGQWGGRVERLRLNGTKADVTLSGTDFRFRFGLRSHWLYVRRTGIDRRWHRMGAGSSKVGGTRGVEYYTHGGAAQHFQKGRIYWSKATGPHEVYGRILTRYRALGAAGSALKFPSSGEVGGGVPGARMSRFQRGRIYWSRDTDAREVYGAILRRYLHLGGPRSRLGLPVTGEYAIRGGRASDFEGGRITWDRSSRKVAVHYK
jgi:stage II sporulation protein D